MFKNWIGLSDVNIHWESYGNKEIGEPKTTTSEECAAESQPILVLNLRQIPCNLKVKYQSQFVGERMRKSCDYFVDSTNI